MELEIERTFQQITWIVKGFLELPQKDGSYLDSPEFLFSGDLYCLRLYPEVNRLTGGITEFHVRRLSVTFPEREVSCELGIRRRVSTGGECYRRESRVLEQNNSYSRSLFKGDGDKYIPDGSLTMVCFMRLSKDSRAGSSAQGEEVQGEFPGHDALFSSRWTSPKMELATEFPCTHVCLTVPKSLNLPRETFDSLTSPEFRFAGDSYCFRLQANDETGDTDLQLVRLTFDIPERTVSYRVGYRWIGYIYPKNSRSLVGRIGFCTALSKLQKERDKYVRGDTFGFRFGDTGDDTVVLFLGLGEQSSAGAWNSHAGQKRTELSGIRELQSDYRQLLQKGTESDACVVVCGKEFKVHKNVLRARSTVFEAMFGHDTFEKESGRVVVDDLDPDSFEDFLEYLYTGDVQDKLSDDNAFSLYAVADKYGVSTLKSECVEHMRRTLSVDSFCDVVTLALRHSEEDLLQRAIRFFKDNIQRIIITAKWQQFMSANSTSANELLIKAIVPGKQ